MKRFTSIVLALCLLLSLSMTAFAADRSRSYTFDLTANGSHEISVKTGDVITVMLELKRTDGGSGLMYAMQDETNTSRCKPTASFSIPAASQTTLR